MTSASTPDPNQMPHPDAADDAIVTHSDWLKQPVQAFFQQINWEDHPPEIHQLQQAATDHPIQSLSPLQPGSHLSQAIHSQASPETGPPSPTSPIVESTSTPEAANPFTLEEFSDLF